MSRRSPRALSRRWRRTPPGTPRPVRPAARPSRWREASRRPWNGSPARFRRFPNLRPLARADPPLGRHGGGRSRAPSRPEPDGGRSGRPRDGRSRLDRRLRPVPRALGARPRPVGSLGARSTLGRVAPGAAGRPGLAPAARARGPRPASRVRAGAGTPLKLAAAAALLFLPVPALAASPPSVGSLGRDLVLSQSVPGRVVAVASNVSIESAVAGDVIVWGGDVSFGPNGSIAGNLVVFGGTIRDRIGPSGRPLPVAGTVSTPGTLLPLYLAEMRRAPWETSVLSPVVWGFKLLALAAWLAIAVALLYVFGSPLARAADRAESDWAGALTAGALGVLTIFLAAAATLTLLPSSIAVPIALLLGVAAVAAKVF